MWGLSPRRKCLRAVTLASGCFNTVISNSVLEHIPDVDAVLIEAARAIQAALIFCSPSENLPSYQFQQHCAA
jgi:2-polyprenyl-3-methyl-5-hydroxy-6-metoxy-1,4-benzoquinol methylase